MNVSSQSYESVLTSSRHVHTNGDLQVTGSSRPMVPTSNGLLNEQLAALLPNLSEEGTLDAHVAARFVSSDAQQRHNAEFGYMSVKPNFKRSYAFGTDHAFSNPSGYSATASRGRPEMNRQCSKRELEQSQGLLRMVVGGDNTDTLSIDQGQPPLVPVVEMSEAEQSEGASSSGDEEDRPAKKRRKSKHRLGRESPPKAARTGKSRKSSLMEDGGKKRRASAATQRLQRENLTEEQKRNNHILSEQKRRNLIKRGFDDLHHLVPEIRNGGLSKSSVLMEAGNFLEKLIQDNSAYSQLTGKRVSC